MKNYIILLCLGLVSAQGTGFGSSKNPLKATPMATEEQKAANLKLYDQLRGRKVVPEWSGDLIDAGSSAALGVVTGAGLKFALSLATGLAYNLVFSAAVIAVGSYTGLIAVKWRRIKQFFSQILPDAVMPTVESISSKFDLNSLDSFASREEVVKMKEELRKLAQQNMHGTLGGCLGLILSFLFI